MWETFFDEKESEKASWPLPRTRSVVYARNVWWREGNSASILGCTMSSKFSLCAQRFLTKRNSSDIMFPTIQLKFKKLNAWNVINVFWREKWRNTKGYTMQLKSERLNAVNVINVFWQRMWWSIMCCNIDRMREIFFDEKEFIKHYVPIPYN